VDAVLICNAYHEFRNPERMLDHVSDSLRPGGRIVVVDRGPRAAERAHEVPLSVVEGELRRKGFEIASQDDRFIDRADNDLWWLVIGRKP
jgi:SAM-dependent methyltransferase